MKVLLTTLRFLPDFVTGTETLTYRVAKELQKRGHTPIIFTGYPVKDNIDNDSRVDDYHFDGLQVYRYKSGPGEFIAEDDAEFRKELVAQHFHRLLKSIRPDLVHCFHLAKLSASPMAVAIDAGIPTIFTTTDYWTVCRYAHLSLPDNSPCAGPDPMRLNCFKHELHQIAPPKFQTAIDNTDNDLLLDVLAQAKVRKLSEATAKRLPGYDHFVSLEQLSKIGFDTQARPEFLTDLLNRTHKVCVTSEFMRDNFRHNGVDENKLVKMPFGIDRTLLEGIAPCGSSNVIRFGFIGSILRHKGVHILTDAAARLAHLTNWSLSIYGDPSEDQQYFGQIQDVASTEPRIQFMGTFAPDNIKAVLATIDVIIVPSLWYENMPLVLLNAQAARRPAIVSDFPGLTEVITDGVNGLTFIPGDSYDLSRALSRIIEEPDLLQRMSVAASQPASIEDYVQQLEKLYEETLN